MSINKKNVLLTIEYDGSDFSGWQIQPEARTVQGELEEALEQVTGEPVKLTGSSRTDAGVHALGAAANFHTGSGIPVERIPTALNNLLSDIRITRAVEEPDDFSARFDALGKTYLYRIITPAHTASHSVPDTANNQELIGYVPDIFLRNYRYILNESLDEGNMIEAAVHFLGTHDFSSFRAASPDGPEDSVRTINELTIHADDAVDTHGRSVRELNIRINGNAFLYNMVRIIVGTLVEIGCGKREAGDIPALINARNRSLAGHTAPAAGLYLERVFYGERV